MTAEEIVQIVQKYFIIIGFNKINERLKNKLIKNNIIDPISTFTQSRASKMTIINSAKFIFNNLKCNIITKNR